MKTGFRIQDMAIIALDAALLCVLAPFGDPCRAGPLHPRHPGGIPVHRRHGDAARHAQRAAVYPHRRGRGAGILRICGRGAKTDRADGRISGRVCPLCAGSRIPHRPFPPHLVGLSAGHDAGDGAALPPRDRVVPDRGKRHALGGARRLRVPVHSVRHPQNRAGHGGRLSRAPSAGQARAFCKAPSGAYTRTPPENREWVRGYEPHIGAGWRGNRCFLKILPFPSHSLRLWNTVSRAASLPSR